MLFAKTPRSAERLRVGVLGDDPLARRVIVNALSAVADRVEVVASMDSSAINAPPQAALSTHAWLLDLGPSYRQDAEGSPLALGGQPLVALAPDAVSAVVALRETGAVSALSREASGPELAAAVEAACLGLTTLDDAFLQALLAPVVPAALEEAAPAEQVHLTNRELEVVELLAEGRSNREVALALDISEHTAKFHISGLLHKLDAATRTEAVVRALRLGMLEL